MNTQRLLASLRRSRVTAASIKIPRGYTRGNIRDDLAINKFRRILIQKTGWTLTDYYIRLEDGEYVGDIFLVFAHEDRCQLAVSGLIDSVSTLEVAGNNGTPKKGVQDLIAFISKNLFGM